MNREFKHTGQDDKITLIKYTGTGGEVVIPTEIGGQARDGDWRRGVRWL